MVFVDYARVTVLIVFASAGEIRFTQIFVDVLSSPNKTYAEATLT